MLIYMYFSFGAFSVWVGPIQVGPIYYITTLRVAYRRLDHYCSRSPPRKCELYLSLQLLDR